VAQLGGDWASLCAHERAKTPWAELERLLQGWRGELATARTLPTAPGAEREPLEAYGAAAARAREELPALKAADERAAQAAEGLVQEARASVDPIAGAGPLGGRC